MHGFNTGDYVQVIDEPDWDCVVGWCDDMTQYCGETARVTRVTPSGTVRIDIDGGRFIWNSQIVKLVEIALDLPDLNPVPPETFQILFG